MDCPSKKLDTYVFNFAKLGQFCHVHKYSFNHGHYSSPMPPPTACPHPPSTPHLLQCCWECTKDGYELGFQAQTRAQRQDDFMITLTKKSNALQRFKAINIAKFVADQMHPPINFFSLWGNRARVVGFWDSFWVFWCSHHVPNLFPPGAQWFPITLPRCAYYFGFL